MFPYTVEVTCLTYIITRKIMALVNEPCKCLGAIDGQIYFPIYLSMFDCWETTVHTDYLWFFLFFFD